MQALVIAQRTLLTQNQNSSNGSNQIPYNGWMAKVKYRSNVAELSEEKTSSAYMDSGATHHFFHSKSTFITYT